MRSLSASELLTVWESSLAATPFERALALLSAGSPEVSPATLARLSIGRRDDRLLQLREWAFGEDLSILVSCPSCRQTLELVMPVQTLRAVDQAPEQEGSITVEGYEVQFRAPNTQD